MIFNFTLLAALLLGTVTLTGPAAGAVTPPADAHGIDSVRPVGAGAEPGTGQPGVETGQPEPESRQPEVETGQAGVETRQSEGLPADETPGPDSGVGGPSGGRVPLPADTADTARRVVHLLEYIAVDYGGSVSDGAVVSRTEYDEQLSFIDEVDSQLTTIGVGANDSVRDRVDALRTAVLGRGAAEQVARQARSLAGELRLRFALQELPPRNPSLQNGRQIYAEACATCHGISGRGDGPRAAALDPKPTNFLDRERMLALPLSAVFATITYGIADTSMASFEEAFGAAERYDLAFYVGSLAFDPADVARGRALAAADSGALASRVAGMSELLSRPAGELAAGGEDSAALVAYARAHPESLEESSVSFAVVRERLEDSWRAYESGNAATASELAVSAYLDGFEPVEPRLDTLDGGLRRSIETGFLRYRELLRAGEPRALIADQRDRLLADIGKAETTLAGSDFGPTAAFVASFTVLAREGFEAVLILLAICGLLVRAGHRDAVRYVHAGWIGALAAGLGTWFVARRLVDISGADREMVEGASSLLAAAILFYVSYWLIAKVSSQRWQAFLQSRVYTALRSGSLWTLASIAFVAVYREVFETILFFEAITSQAGPAGLRSVVLGALAGVLAITALAVGAFRFGLGMPVRRFFFVSSGLLYLLSIVLAGQGVAALQEAGVVPATHFAFVQIDWLGIHPTLQSLGLQIVLIAAALLAAAWTLLRRDREPPVAARKAAA